MPIFIDPTVANPPLPVEMTGVDGILAGKFLSSRVGVLLRASYPATVLVQHTFEANSEQWVSIGTGSVSRETAAPMTGTASLRLDWSAAGLQGIERTYADPGYGTGRTVRVKFRVKCTAPTAPAPELVVTASDAKGIVATKKLPWPVNGLVRDWFTDLTIPIGRKVSTLRFSWTSVAGNQFVLFDTIQLVGQAATQVRISRDDGFQVRGGDPAEAPSGIAYAYDDELLPGTDMHWWAEPIYDSGWIGPASALIGFTIADRDKSKPSTILKSLEDPDNSVEVYANWKDFKGARGVAFTALQSGGQPVGSVLTDFTFADEVTFITDRADQVAAMFSLISEPLIYVQTPARFLTKRPFYATVTQFTVNDFGRMDGLEKIWNLTLQQVARPSTFGQRSVLPIRSYDSLNAGYVSYTELAATGKTYNDLIWDQV